MCLGAIYWARLDHLYYGANKHDAAAAGFDDQFIYEEIELPYANRHLKTASLLEDEAQAPFTLWAQHEERVAY
jgi:tRNA(Arg) A34 adenosine deaminase TadA